MIPFIYSETRAPTVSRVHPHHQIILFLVSLCFHVLIRTILGDLVVEHIYNVVVYCLADMKMFAYMNLSRIEQISLSCVLPVLSFLSERKIMLRVWISGRKICSGMVRRLRHCFSALLCHSQQWMFLEKHFNDSFNKGFKLSVSLCNANKLWQFRVCWQFANKFIFKITTQNRTQRMLCQEHWL